LPPFVTECDESQPCTHNPLGAKGCGEAGSIGAPAAVVSAGLDALAPLGVTDLDMPLTSEQLWRRIRNPRAEAQSSESEARTHERAAMAEPLAGFVCWHGRNAAGPSISRRRAGGVLRSCSKRFFHLG